MIERRYIEIDEAEPLQIEERSGHAPKIRGRAIVYNSRSKDLGGFTEIIDPGAFDHILSRQRPKLDVVALWNHEASQLLGRTTSGTLRLIPDERGVAFELDPPDTTLGRDLMTLCRRGDIAGCSFAFTVDKDGERVDTGEDGSHTRHITRASGLFDVSLVTNPAYAATAVSVRSVEAAKAAAAAAAAPAPAEPKPLTADDRLAVAKARASIARRAVRIMGVALAVALFAGDAHAIGRRRSSGYSTTYAAPVGGDTSTAQGVAEACARMGRLAHMGGNGGMMEGIGMASTPEAAIRNCCFYGQISIADQGVAQGRNGMWYACIRGR